MLKLNLQKQKAIRRLTEVINIVDSVDKLLVFPDFGQGLYWETSKSI